MSRGTNSHRHSLSGWAQCHLFRDFGPKQINPAEIDDSVDVPVLVMSNSGRKPLRVLRDPADHFVEDLVIDCGDHEVITGGSSIVVGVSPRAS